MLDSQEDQKWKNLEGKTEMKGPNSLIKYLFFNSYKLFITKEKNYTRFLLRFVLAVDRLFHFKFIKEFSRRQHSSFSLDDENKIVKLIGNKLIDIGSGMGYWGLLLMDSGREIMAIELSKPYIRFTKMLGVYRVVIRASGDFLPFKSDYFDTALALEIIEHVDKESGLLLAKEARRVSRCAVISTPRMPSPNSDLPSWVPETEKHQSEWTEQEFKAEGFTTSILGESILAVTDNDSAKVENPRKN